MIDVELIFNVPLKDGRDLKIMAVQIRHPDTYEYIGYIGEHRVALPSFEARDALKWASRVLNSNSICPECSETGERDSGGSHPWGESINLPCGCGAENNEVK